MNTAGYSGTPLAKKLGLRAGTRMVLKGAPAGFRELLGELPEGVELIDAPAAGVEADILHIFTNSRDGLFRELDDARHAITQDGAVWVSWYKKAAKLPTEITEDTIREAALPLGLVDVKVCAVDEQWSGLKLVIRKENRSR